MFEQDYIMRLIKEMVRVLLKLLFRIDVESSETPGVDMLKEEKERRKLEELQDMIDAGRINEAENKVSDLLDEKDQKNLELAILFYSYLNDKSNEFLLENHFSREEVKSGLMDTLEQYGLSGMTEVFL